jgi:hypothetical protein
MIVWVEVGRGVVVEPEDVYWLEAEGAATWERLRGRDRMRNRRSLGKVVEALVGFGFLRFRCHAVSVPVSVPGFRIFSGATHRIRAL